MGALKTVKKARKEYDCVGCDNKIKIGEPYYFLAYRFQPKRKFCKRHPLPRPSQLAQGTINQGLLAVGESLYDDFNAIKTGNITINDMASSIESNCQELENICDEIDEKIQNIQEHFPDSPKAEEMEERKYEIDEWKDELISVQDTLDNLKRPIKKNCTNDEFRLLLKGYIQERKDALDEVESVLQQQP